MIQQVELTEETHKIWDECVKQSHAELPFLTYQWNEAYFQTIGKSETPHILYTPEYHTIIPFTLRASTLLFSGEQEICDYQDIIGPDEHKAEVWKTVLEFLKQGKQSEILLTNISQASSTLTFFQQFSSNNFLVTITERDTTPVLSLPRTYDEYLTRLSRKDRHELRRKIRRFHEAHPNSEIELCENVPNDFDTLINLMKLDERKATFFTPSFEAFFRKLPILFPEQIILQVLCIDNKPATATLSFKTPTSFLLYNSGFDQEHYPGAGFYLKAESIRWAIEHGFKEYNFLRGHERYKYELGGKDFAVYDIRITRKD